MSVFMKHAFFRRIASTIIKKSSGIQFLSAKHRDFFLDNFVGVNDKTSVYEKSFIAYNGLEKFWLENIYQPRHILNTDILKLLLVGNISERKNIPVIIQSIKILKKWGYNAVLTVVGKVIDIHIYEKIKKEEFVEIKEFMPKEDLIKIYRNSNIFVMASKLETFGRVYAEAMTQGLPVIYTKGQGFDGVFEDGHIGFLVPSDDQNIFQSQL